jgi:DedD protein
MGLFNRKDSAPDTPTGRPRPSVSSEAHAVELRARARRRLAGAVALVLAAVIILPMVLDSEPTRVSDDIPIRIPDRNSPYQPSVSEPQQAPAAAADPGAQTGATAGVAGPVAVAPPPPASGTPAPGADAGKPAPAKPESGRAGDPAHADPARPESPPRTETRSEPVRPDTARTETRAETKPETKPAAKPEPAPRSDDGSRALALLEGRNVAASPAKPTPDTRAAADAKGNFVLQIAAYTTQADAQARRDKLHGAGVTNAFVQEASVGGKQQYRLRVGPFPSREAAQAAQARLRTLGYDNGFIAAQ